MIKFTIIGEPASKANSREVATIGAKKMDVLVGQHADGTMKFEKMKVGGRILNRKCDKALDYEESALKQIPPLARVRLQGPIRLTAKIFYASRRPDMDASIIRDVLQDRYVKNKFTKQRELVQHGVYLNDRQVKEEHYYWALDPNNPRAEIVVEQMDEELFAYEPAPRAVASGSTSRERAPF